MAGQPAAQLSANQPTPRQVVIFRPKMQQRLFGIAAQFRRAAAANFAQSGLQMGSQRHRVSKNEVRT